MEQIQKAVSFIEISDFSENAKLKMKKVLEGKTVMTPGLSNEIKEIMQNEIDQDFDEQGVDVSAEPETQEIQKKYDSALVKIETDLAEDQKFVEEQIGEVEKTSKELAKIEDELKAEEIRKKLLASM